MGNYQELKVWQLAKGIAVEIYKLGQKKEIKTDFGFRDQIQRSAISIPSNIAEGDEMGSNKQSIRFFYIAKGSSAELQTQLIIANEIGYLSNGEADKLINDCRVISVMLSKLIKSRGV